MIPLTFLHLTDMVCLYLHPKNPMLKSVSLNARRYVCTLYLPLAHTFLCVDCTTKSPLLMPCYTFCVKNRRTTEAEKCLFCSRPLLPLLVVLHRYSVHVDVCYFLVSRTLKKCVCEYCIIFMCPSQLAFFSSLLFIFWTFNPLLLLNCVGANSIAKVEININFCMRSKLFS